jgi:hypothetical protein
MRLRVLGLPVLLASTLGTARAQDIPVANWTVPTYAAKSSHASGLSRMSDISPTVGFTAVTPCRVVDTRNAAGPFGGPALSAHVARTFDIDGGPCSDIPVGVDAYSLSIGAILPPADGFLTAWPTFGPQPTVSQLNFLAGEVTANAAIVPASSNGSIDVLVNVGPTHVYIDINGYFSDNQNPAQSLTVRSSSVTPALIAENSTTQDYAETIHASLTSLNPGLYATAIRGVNYGSGSNGIAIWGSSSGSGIGVFGTSGGGPGIRGVSSIGPGVLGTTFPTSPGQGGVVGEAYTSQQQAYGVSGTIYPAGQFAGLDSAGIFGRILSSFPTGRLPAGVRGEANYSYGLLGLSRTTAVAGDLISGVTTAASGFLGVTFDPEGGAPFWGVFATGNVGATGTKSFVEPHPTDPTRVIQYIALEGREAGTYFRGRARFQRGLASIPVPEDFRMVTDPDGLTVQITPIGEMASFAIVRMDLDRIVVKGSRDVEFSYLVQGVRASFKDAQPIIRDGTFVPQSPDARMPAALSERQKRVLVANGTYNEDGTVNRETARQYGWEEMWSKRHEAPSRVVPAAP